MSLEAEIRFLEFLCIADVEGRRKKEDPSCYRPQWFQQLRNFSQSGAVAIEVVGWMRYTIKLKNLRNTSFGVLDFFVRHYLPSFY